MNFLLHHHLAAHELAAEPAGLGAMLPDVWRMADRRARAREGPTDAAQPLHLGVQHHLAVDRWFHGTSAHEEGETRATRLLAEAGTDAPKLRLFGHVVWEMALDGALVRRDGARPLCARVRAALDGARDSLTAVSEAWGTTRAIPAGHERERFHARVTHLLTEIARGPWIAGYAEPEGLCDRLSGVRSRFGLPPLIGDDRERVARALEDLLAHAEATLPTLLAERAVTRG